MCRLCIVVENNDTVARGFRLWGGRGGERGHRGSLGQEKSEGERDLFLVGIGHHYSHIHSQSVSTKIWEGYQVIL